MKSHFLTVKSYLSVIVHHFHRTIACFFDLSFAAVWQVLKNKVWSLLFSLRVASNPIRNQKIYILSNHVVTSCHVLPNLSSLFCLSILIAALCRTLIPLVCHLMALSLSLFESCQRWSQPTALLRLQPRVIACYVCMSVTWWCVPVASDDRLCSRACLFTNYYITSQLLSRPPFPHASKYILFNSVIFIGLTSFKNSSLS